MLAARHAAYRRQVEWSRARLPYPRRTISRFLLGGIVIALLVGAVAWTLPFTARDNILGAAWERLNDPMAEIAEQWNDLLARVAGSGESDGGSYSAFGESFRLGGHLQLSDDPVILMQPAGGPMRPAYLAGQRYDSYSCGWTTTVDDTFQAVGSDGQRYSSRLSFRTGQGVHLSPNVTDDRSQVEANLSVIRPKAAASSPISSREVGVTGWSSFPEPTTAMAAVSSRIGRARLREISHEATRPRTRVSAMLTRSVRPSAARISSSRA